MPSEVLIMETAKLIIAIVQLIVCIGLVVVVIFQPGKVDGMSGALVGSSSESFFSKNKGKTWEAALEKITTVGAIAFMVLSVALYILG